VTGKKEDQKTYYSHSQYPGALKATPYKQLMDQNPTMVSLVVFRSSYGRARPSYMTLHFRFWGRLSVECCPRTSYGIVDWKDCISSQTKNIHTTVTFTRTTPASPSHKINPNHNLLPNLHNQISHDIILLLSCT
jgi:hypothetical protein